MAVKGRIQQLAVLVNTTPETLVEIMGDMSRETLNELQVRNPRAGGRVARNLRRHRRMQAQVSYER